MATYRDEAIVLRTWDLGEADRIISLFTLSRGKVRAVARSIRRTSSKFGSRLEPFSHVDVQLAEGRGSLDVVTQAEILHEPLLGLDYDRFTAAQVIVEAAEKVVSEDHTPSPAQYRLLLGALVALTYRPLRLVVDSYLLRALATDGHAVAVEHCATCGGQADWFSPRSGGGVCTRCKPPGASAMSADVRRHLGGLLSGDWEQISHAAPGVITRGHQLVDAYTTWFLEHNLRSMKFLAGD